ncbi:hypothetical protein Acy02nite_16140 [Actinoplanes cyaneus]|uniref:Uncharacterized protein n=1 Tax=Actinoplanes cyaneus TaxID=52696 RepID=A0A919IHV8_9ACTN|nr:hypothetical protein [Actinoplanes cyaneus]MCW2142110.1 hypothetical protein [Actinoplanes cyaneus]GID63733.1 hypothetical protein Acy02nite_16140 [Actinoplanes cyaneus]
MGDLHLEPEVVERCGDRLAAAGAAVDAQSRSFTGTRELAAAHPGIASALTLDFCRRNWSDRIESHGTGIRLLGDNLHFAVREYQAADARHAALLRGHSRVPGE